MAASPAARITSPEAPDAIPVHADKLPLFNCDAALEINIFPVWVPLDPLDMLIDPPAVNEDCPPARVTLPPLAVADTPAATRTFPPVEGDIPTSNFMSPTTLVP
jgi:hypothetical protein